MRASAQSLHADMVMVSIGEIVTFSPASRELLLWCHPSAGKALNN